ncbi:MAG: hypothetical protein IJ088_13900 [Clostridia bacterium]|nr:hypothetical protein [Clostridia bacterium]
MRKTIILLLILFAFPVSAGAAVVTAMATEPYMEQYQLYSCNARILDYNSETNLLRLTLITPEIFPKDEVEALGVGDAIYTGGREIPITSVSYQDGYLVFNRGTEEFEDGSVWLSEDSDGNYRTIYWHDNVWTEIEQLELPVTEALLLLDRINPETGESLEKPTVHPSTRFIRMMEEAARGEDPGFSANNVLVVFNAEGQLAVIERYYVPWQ